MKPLYKLIEASLLVRTNGQRLKGDNWRVNYLSKKQTVFIVLIALVLISCKSSQKVISNSKLNNETNINSDLLINDEKQLLELSNHIINRIIKEHVNIEFQQIKYDTNKPIILETSKNPIAEEIKINIHKNKKVNETDSIYNEKKGLSIVEIVDKSTESTKIEANTIVEKHNLKRYHKVLISINVIVVIGFILFFVIKLFT